MRQIVAQDHSLVVDRMVQLPHNSWEEAVPEPGTFLSSHSAVGTSAISSSDSDASLPAELKCFYTHFERENISLGVHISENLS